MAETAAEIEGEDAKEERPKRPKRLDKDGFAIPDIPVPIDPALQSQSTDTSSHAEPESSSPATQADESSDAERPKRRGRPRGAKNRNAPEPTTAETVLEAEIERDILASMNSQAMRDANPEPSSSRAALEAPSSPVLDEVDEGTQPESTETETEPTESRTQPALQKRKEIRMDPEILDHEFDDDPEVANAVLTEEEIRIKEHIWVEENKQWLRNEHAKRIKKELQDAADIAAGITPGQNNKKKRRRGRRIGDVSYLKDQQTGDQGDQGDENEDPAARSRRSASLAMKGMLEQRGYSRRLNYDALSKMFPDDMAGLGEKNIGSRRSRRKETSTPSRQTSVAATPDATATTIEQPNAGTPPATNPANVPDSTTTIQAPTAQQPALPTPSATQAIQSPPAPPVIEGEEELVGSIDSESPLSAIGAGYHAPSLIGVAHGGGFGEEGDDGEDDEEDDGEDDDEEGDYDGVEDALHGRYTGGYESGEG